MKVGGLKPKPMKRKPLKASVASKMPRRRTKLPKVGKSPIAKVKKAIQAQLRANAIKRDKTCVIGQYQESLPEQWRVCGPLRKDGEIILQAEHLVGRGKSLSYADMDNILLVCMRHHFYFKTQKPLNYWSIVRFHIGDERWEKLQEWEKDKNVHKHTAQDWRNKLQALETLK